MFDKVAYIESASIRLKEFSVGDASCFAYTQ